MRRFNVTKLRTSATSSWKWFHNVDGGNDDSNDNRNSDSHGNEFNVRKFHGDAAGLRLIMKMSLTSESFLVMLEDLITLITMMVIMMRNFIMPAKLWENA